MENMKREVVPSHDCSDIVVGVGERKGGYLILRSIRAKV